MERVYLMFTSAVNIK